MVDRIFLITAILLVIIDFIYLSLIKNFFIKQIITIQGSNLQIDFIATIICYIFLIIGINYFIILPHRSISDAFLLGLVIYAVYETTNKALFTRWNWSTVIVDTLWGGILFALTTFCVYKIKKLLK
jgi:uncharacterized membrane protein